MGRFLGIGFFSLRRVAEFALTVYSKYCFD